MKDLKEESVDFDQTLNIVNEKGEEDRTIKDITKDYQDKIEQIEEAFLNYLGEIELEILNAEFPDNKWKYSIKNVLDPYEYFESLIDY